MLSKREPATWQELQEMVAQILIECGFSTEVEKKIQSVRGEVEIDVYAEEKVFNRLNIILFECKYWKSKIPQNIIHGFRTVLSDTGANTGYIISSSGFQSGSFSASEKTNIKLRTWYEFQDEFEDMWLQKYFLPTLSEKLDPLFSYIEPLHKYPNWFDSLDENQQNKYLDLYERHTYFGNFLFMFSKWCQFDGYKKENITLPIIEKIGKKVDMGRYALFMDILNENSYREFLEKAVQYGEKTIVEFRSFEDIALQRPGGSH